MRTCLMTKKEALKNFKLLFGGLFWHYPEFGIPFMSKEDKINAWYRYVLFMEKHNLITKDQGECWKCPFGDDF